jgi:hypothetical protein
MGQGESDGCRAIDLLFHEALTFRKCHEGAFYRFGPIRACQTGSLLGQTNFRNYLETVLYDFKIHCRGIEPPNPAHPAPSCLPAVTLPPALSDVQYKTKQFYSTTQCSSRMDRANASYQFLNFQTHYHSAPRATRNLHNNSLFPSFQKRCLSDLAFIISSAIECY